MATKIIIFDPHSIVEVERAENELDDLLNTGWEIISTTGAGDSSRSFVTLILHETRYVPVLPKLQGDERGQSGQN